MKNTQESRKGEKDKKKGTNPSCRGPTRPVQWAGNGSSRPQIKMGHVGPAPIGQVQPGLARFRFCSLNFD